MKTMRRPLVQPVAVVLLCATALTACANDEKKNQAWEQDKQQMSSSIQLMNERQNRAEEIDREQITMLTELNSRIEMLEKQDKAKQSQIDALSKRVEALHRRPVKRVPAPVAAPAAKAKAVVKPAPKPVPKTEAKHRTTPVKPPQPVVAAAQPKVDQAAMAEAEKNAYTSAYLALKSGRFDEASTAFNKQLDLYPNGEYADQAWYWLGETRFAQGDNNRALNAFKYVADHYAGSVKHAAALMKLGQISEAQSKWQQAVSYYKRLITEHADSTLAEQAREAVAKIQGDQPAGSERAQ